VLRRLLNTPKIVATIPKHSTGFTDYRFTGYSQKVLIDQHQQKLGKLEMLNHSQIVEPSRIVYFELTTEQRYS
jgi:hypothetical protein